MVKCRACQNKICNEDNDFSDRCEDPQNCSCTCQESTAASFWKGLASITVGAGAVAGGVALTVMSGGVAAVIIGGVAVGGGASMVTNPISKKISGERMTGEDYLKDVGTGAVMGIATGGIGAGGSALTKGAATAVKLGVRAGAGAIGGATGNVISGVIKGEEISLKSVALSTLAGAAGGASANVSGCLSNKVSGEVGKAVVRIGTQATTAGLTDVGLQLVETGKVDCKRLALTTSSALAVATSSEAGRGIGVRTKANANSMNKEMIKEDFPKPEDKALRDDIFKRTKEANKLAKSEIKKQENKVSQYNDLSDDLHPKIKDVKEWRQNLETDLDIAQQEKDTFMKQKNPAAEKKAKFEAFKEYQELTTAEIRSADKHNKEMRSQLKTAKPDRFGKDSFHLLNGERTGQAAMGFSDQNGNLGKERAIMKVDKMGGRRFLYEGFTPDHNYEDFDRIRGPANPRPRPERRGYPTHLLPRREEEENQEE